MLEVRLLGTFEVRCDGGPVTLPSRSAQSLFAYLILNAGTAYRREKLAGLFWPDSSEDRARASLRHELWRIRKVLTSSAAKDILLTDELTVAFDASSEYWLDARELERLGDDASAQDLIEGLSLYRGELLPGFYDDWLTLEREHLQLVFEQRLGRLLHVLEAEGRWSEMVDWAERWLSLGQNPDAAYRSLMVAYTGMGDRAKVLATYERCVQALHALGLKPSEDVRALVEARRSDTNLPLPLTTLIGREIEVQEVSDLLQTARLVTLTGAGGVGKTRLAIEVARGLADRFPEGAHYLELAPLRDPTMVPERLLALLGIRARANENQSMTDLLVGHFRSRHALLVLDNCEHLIDACAQLANALMASCPALHILTTSREALRVPSEIAFRVPSLAIPTSNDRADLGTLGNVDSVRLFVERARTRSRTFALTVQNAQLVAELCVRLDGIPLAIELAAARANTLTLEDIVEHLSDRFALLSGGLRTDIPRHQTLRAMIDWSCDLLSEPERTLLRRLSVFTGGWTLDASQKVAADGILCENDVLALLPELVEKSLVVLDVASGRYHMLETVREYSVKRLKEAGEEAALRTRHLDYLLALAETADMAAKQGEAASALLAIERDNLLSAIAWCESAENGIQKGLLLIGATRLAWLLLAQTDLPYHLARRLLSLPGAEPRNFARCRALLTLVQTGYYAGYGADVLQPAEESVSIAREIGDRRREAQALNLFGTLLAQAGNPKAGLHHLEEALQIARALGLHRLAGKILGDTAAVLRAEGDLAAAEAMYDQAILVQWQANAPHDLIFSLLSAAAIAIVSGNLISARQRLLEVLSLMVETPLGLTDAAPPLQIFACFLTAVADWRHAAVLFGAAERQRELENRILEPADKIFSAPLVQRTCEALGERDFHAAWAEGRRLPVEKAVASAHTWLSAEV